MLEILYEDNHIIAVNKKISDIVQADKTGDTPLSEEVKAYIKKKYNKPGEVFLGVPHRVDRPVSGVVIFARTSKASLVSVEECDIWYRLSTSSRKRSLLFLKPLKAS